MGTPIEHMYHLSQCKPVSKCFSPVYMFLMNKTEKSFTNMPPK